MKFNPQNEFRRQPMVFITFGLIVGILLGKFIPVPYSISAITIIIPIIIVFIYKTKYSNYVLIVLMIVLGFTLSANNINKFNRSLDKVLQFSEQKVTFTGIIVEINNYSSGQRFILDNVQLSTEFAEYSKSIQYIVYPKNETLANINIGDTLKGSGKYQLFKDIRIPGQYEARKYYHNKNIAGRIYANSKISAESNNKLLFFESINNLREVVRSKITTYSDKDTEGLLSALILGDRTKIDQDLREAFANVGVIHVLAVSGLHVGYVLVILILLAKILRIPWGFDKILIIIGLILFTLLSGGRASVVRASIMASLYVLAPLINRRANPWNIIATAAFIILLINPNSIYDLGFQLSFAAVISIIYFYNLFNRLLPSKFRVAGISNRFIRFFWSLFLITLAAQVGTIPITAFYFGRIPLIAIFANLIIIPLIGGFVALGFAKLILFWIFPMSFFIDQLCWLIKELIYLFISIFDMFPFASILTPQFNWVNLIQYILIILIIFMLLQRKTNRLIIASLLLLNFIIWPWVLEKKGMDIIVLDLGNNESTIIQTAEKRNVLINFGVISMFTDNVNRAVLPTLKHLNINKLNWLIKSKGNSNHQVAAVKTIESIEIEEIWDTEIDSNSGFDSQFMSLVELKNINYNQISRGDIIRLDEQSYLQFLLPIENSQNETSSLAFKLVNGINSILFIERLTDSQYKILINDGTSLNSDIVKMTYPKTISANFIEFYKTVNPKKTIISGARTTKNSPSLQELNELINSEVYFTDSIGTVWLFSDGQNPFEIKEWK